MGKAGCIAFLLLSCAGAARAASVGDAADGRWRVRAREHYERVDARSTAGAGRTLLVFGTVVGAVLALGGARIALDPPAAPTVRIASLAPNRAASDALTSAKLARGPYSAAQRAELRQRTSHRC